MTITADNLQSLPADLPTPVDDGACRHLRGLAVPRLPLPSTDGGAIDLATLPGRTVVFCYPMTGRPGVALPPGWDDIPGARGCTPEACAFRDRHALFGQRRVALYGLSTQATDYQHEAAVRLHLPYALLSDAGCAFASGLRLPLFDVAGMRLIRRLTLVLNQGVVEHCFYPVFPPDRHADEVLAWLEN